MPQRKKLTFERGNKQMNGKYRLVAEDRRYKYTIIPKSSGTKVRLEVTTKMKKFHEQLVMIPTWMKPKRLPNFGIKDGSNMWVTIL